MDVLLYKKEKNINKISIKIINFNVRKVVSDLKQLKLLE